MAEVEQAGEADDQVEAERQHHVKQREVEDAHPTAAELPGDEGRGDGDDDDQPARGGGVALAQPGHGGDEFVHVFAQARSDTRSPSSPVGRKISTRPRMMKAKMSW